MAAVVTIVIIPVIVKGLSKMVPWEKYGCEVVDTNVAKSVFSTQTV